MAIRLRAAELRDLDPITSLVSRANATYREWAGDRWLPPEPKHDRLAWRERIETPDAWTAVAESNEDFVGCLSFVPGAAPGLAHLSRLFVDPDWWRSGIGSALLSQAIAEMCRRGFERAELFTAAANAGSRAFYERHGWRPTSDTREWQGLTLVRYTLDSVHAHMSARA